MTRQLRDHFAGQALVAILPEYNGTNYREEVAKECYLLADAMIAAR